MAYATPLEARIAKKVTRAITDYGLIEDGDRVMVGLSGGKDSWALIQILDVLRQRAPIDFSLVAVNVDSGYDGYRTTSSPRRASSAGWEYRIEHTNIGEVMDDLLDARRDAVLALRAAAPRRALPARDRGRRDQDRARPSPRRLHRDAAAEPVLRRRLKAMPARLVSDDGEHVVIRPLVLRERSGGARLREGVAACRSSAAAARRAATSACSASASSG